MGILTFVIAHYARELHVIRYGCTYIKDRTVYEGLINSIFRQYKREVPAKVIHSMTINLQYWCYLIEKQDIQIFFVLFILNKTL